MKQLLPFWGKGEKMDTKVIAVIAVVAIVAVGGIAGFAIMNNNKAKEDPLAYFDNAGLKVLGNANGDNVIDSTDYAAVQKLIEDKKSVGDNKLADANNDGTLDEKDLEVIDKVIKKEQTVIWHINYHDTDSNGIMDRELVSTKVPVTSTIMTGSANNFMIFTLLGIPAGTTVKGACYSSSNDSFLYGDTFLKTTLVEKLGSKSYEIPFEDGKIGSSDIIKDKNVTCLVTDWNRTYIENEAAFETAGVDVVRIAAASFEKDVYTHSLLLMGLVFNVDAQAKKILDLYDKTYDEINTAVKTLSSDKVKKAVASSMDGGISSEDSDYTAVCVAAGAEFGLKGYDFGGSTLIYVSENLGVFDTRQYNFDNIVHIRTALTYGSKAADIADSWATYANAMSMWEKAYEGQVLISGSIPVPCRVAYAAYAIYHDTLPALSETWADTLLTDFEAEYHGVDMSKSHNSDLAITSCQYSVTISDDVTVKDKDNNVVATGTKFAYGTELSIEAKTPVATKTLVASGSSIKDGKFLVVNNIDAKYVDNTVLDKLSTVATKFVEKCEGNIYMQKGAANTKDVGSISLTSMSYGGSDKTTTIQLTYYEDIATAKSKYDSSAATVTGKSGNAFDASSIVGETADNGITIKFTSNVYKDKAYTGGSTIYMTAYYKNVVWEYKTYFSHYTFDEAFKDKTDAQALEYFQSEVTKLAQAIEDSFKEAYAA